MIEFSSQLIKMSLNGKYQRVSSVNLADFLTFVQLTDPDLGHMLYNFLRLEFANVCNKLVLLSLVGLSSLVKCLWVKTKDLSRVGTCPYPQTLD